MKYLLPALLACLILAVPAGAVTGFVKAGSTINIQVLPDITCSQETYPPFPNSSVIWVVFVTGEKGDIYINGEAKMPVNGLPLGGKPGWQYYANPNIYTVDITRHGYALFSKKVQTCEGKVTYVYYDLSKQVITTVPTTTMTTAIAAPPTTVTQVQGGYTQQQTQAVTAAVTAGATAQPDTLGSLSVKTEPAGAFIFIDGVQRGVAPATIPGIPAGTHTLLLKLDGYQDISTPVTISAGKTQEYSSAMAKVSATAAATTAAAVPADTTVTPKKSPGFAFIAALAGLGAVLYMRKGRAG